MRCRVSKAIPKLQTKLFLTSSSARFPCNQNLIHEAKTFPPASFSICLIKAQICWQSSTKFLLSFVSSTATLCEIPYPTSCRVDASSYTFFAVQSFSRFLKKALKALLSLPDKRSLCLLSQFDYYCWCASSAPEGAAAFHSFNYGSCRETLLISKLYERRTRTSRRRGFEHHCPNFSLRIPRMMWERQVFLWVLRLKLFSFAFISPFRRTSHLLHEAMRNFSFCCDRYVNDFLMFQLLLSLFCVNNKITSRSTDEKFHSVWPITFVLRSCLLWQRRDRICLTLHVNGLPTLERQKAHQSVALDCNQFTSRLIRLSSGGLFTSARRNCFSFINCQDEKKLCHASRKFHSSFLAHPHTPTLIHVQSLLRSASISTRRRCFIINMRKRNFLLRAINKLRAWRVEK